MKIVPISTKGAMLMKKFVRYGQSEKDVNSYNKEGKDNIRWIEIDLMEFIAIFLVLLWHGRLYSFDFLADGRLLHYVRYLFSAIISTCVPLFFFANGYLLFNRNFSLKKHIFKTIKLVILAVVWGLLTILILMPIENEYLSFKEIIKALWIWKQGWINPLWFLGALVCIYIFFPLLKHAYDGNKPVFIYFVAVCAILTFGNTLLNEGGTIFLSKVLHENTVVQWKNFFNMFNPFRGIYGYAFVYFCAGGYMYKIKDKLLSVNVRKRNIFAVCAMIISCLCLWGVGICYSTASNEIWNIVWNGYDTVFTFINVICIYILCLNLKREFKLIRMISCNTLGIYLIHEIFIHLTKDFIKEFSFLCNVPFNLLYALAVLFVSLIITLIMRKIPYVKKLVS